MDLTSSVEKWKLDVSCDKSNLERMKRVQNSPNQRVKHRVIIYFIVS